MQTYNIQMCISEPDVASYVLCKGLHAMAETTNISWAYHKFSWKVKSWCITEVTSHTEFWISHRDLYYKERKTSSDPFLSSWWGCMSVEILHDSPVPVFKQKAQWPNSKLCISARLLCRCAELPGSWYPLHTCKEEVLCG